MLLDEIKRRAALVFGFIFLLLIVVATMPAKAVMASEQALCPRDLSGLLRRGMLPMAGMSECFCVSGARRERAIGCAQSRSHLSLASLAGFASNG